MSRRALCFAAGSGLHGTTADPPAMAIGSQPSVRTSTLSTLTERRSQSLRGDFLAREGRDQRDGITASTASGQTRLASAIRLLTRCRFDIGQLEHFAALWAQQLALRNRRIPKTLALRAFRGRLPRRFGLFFPMSKNIEQTGYSSITSASCLDCRCHTSCLRSVISTT